MIPWRTTTRCVYDKQCSFCCFDHQISHIAALQQRYRICYGTTIAKLPEPYQHSRISFCFRTRPYCRFTSPIPPESVKLQYEHNPNPNPISITHAQKLVRYMHPIHDRRRYTKRATCSTLVWMKQIKQMYSAVLRPLSRT